MKARLKKIMQSTFFNIMASAMIPAILVIVFAVIAANIYITNYTDSIKTSYLSKISIIAEYNENSLNNISQLLDTLQSDRTFVHVISGHDNKSESIKHVTDIFEKIKQGNKMVDSIIAVDRKSKKVYTTNGVADMTTFFSDSFVYDNYDSNYWYSYQSAFSSKRIFPPCQVSKEGTVDNIIPIVFTKIANEPFGNIIIVNIKLSYLKRGFEDEKISDNGTLKMFSLSKQVLYSTDNSVIEEANSDFRAKILSDKKTTFDYIINGKKSLIISYTPRYSMLGYAYVAVVPYSDINKVLYNILIIFCVLGIVMLTLAFVCAYFGSKRIFMSILKVSNKFQNQGKYSYKDDVIKEITEKIDDIVCTNIALSDRRKAELPILQEWYLIKLLNSNEEYREIIREDDSIEFEHDCFCSVVFQIKPTKFFYEYYDREKYNLIYSAISEFITNNFEKYYKTYVISTEPDAIYLVLNLENLNEGQKIKQIIANIKRMLHNDKDYLSCISSNGEIYQGIDGLKKSHDEAVENLYSVSKIDRVEITTRKPVSREEMIEFSQKHESELYNYLFAAQTEKAISLVENIVAKNSKKQLSGTEINNMYSRLFYVILKVLRDKNIQYDTNGVGDYELLNSYTLGSTDETHKRLIDMIRSVQTYGNEKLGMTAIIDYIQTHYMEDLYLEKLSEIFGLSPKYLSKVFKEETKVNFKEYLINLRINKAIELLKKNKPISEIYQMVGFNNRNTFNRLFKAKTGLTPTEYKREMEH